ncbi:efflux RND transporter periplasmic adaptor subunit [Cytobacillus purgationiresistens]|uniref:HlyD family secretion protein n=1 Tax=Cytobacillus purgationiresistens TaxID=863449 RepID=A0ABU0AQP0_9BACI|nr:efflux RND transporter periplasmic adaptor subunit [Cytobacillus purgationiresistens]MDQ0273535.1 HlyD family secretion protein [Cytobacillus purgationiresistens]
MNKKVWVAVGVGLLILVMAGVSVYRQAFAKGPSVTVVQPEKEEITDYLMIPGTLSLKNEQKIFTSMEQGEIEEVLVEEGEAVEEGTILAKYNEKSVAMELERINLQIESGYLRINQVEKSLTNLQEQEEDLRKQIGKKEAKKQIDPERDQLTMDKRMANLDVHQLLLEKKEIEQRMEQLAVKSTMNGKVLQINEMKSSDPLAQQAPIIHIGNLDEKVARGTLSEYDTLKVEKGMTAVLKSDVLPDKEWKGEVSQISFTPDESQPVNPGELRAAQYGILVDIKDDISSLKPGFQLIVEIETSRKSALTIPAEAVLTDDAASYVFLLKDGKSVKHEVEIGIASGSKMEVLSGLAEGDQVIANPSDSLQDGMEVNAK